MATVMKEPKGARVNRTSYFNLRQWAAIEEMAEKTGVRDFAPLSRLAFAALAEKTQTDWPDGVNANT